jgi:hypothetical protein
LSGKARSRSEYPRRTAESARKSDRAFAHLGAHARSREDDVAWPKKNIVGRQELEVRIDKEHISFEVSPFGASCSSFRRSCMSFGRRGTVADFWQTAKIGSLADVNDSQDAEGLRVFYYLVQDLKVGLHWPMRGESHCMI